MSVTVDILWADSNGESSQKKKFKDEMSAIEWIRKHYKNVTAINGYFTWGEKVSHFEIMDALKGVH